MAGKDTDEAVRALADFASDNRSIRIGDTDYELSKLRPSDLAKARDYVVDLRIKANVKSTGGMTFHPTMRAKMMAEIQCAPLTTFDLIQDSGGRIKLLHLSLVRGGHKVTIEQVGDMEAVLQDELFAYCAWISGILPEPIEPEGGADPLETTATTS